MDDGLQWLLTQRTDFDFRKMLGTSEGQRSSYLRSASDAIEALPRRGEHSLDMTQMEEPINGFSVSLGYCFLIGDDATALKIRVLDQMPTFFRWLLENGPHEQNGAIFMFWDALVPRARIRAPIKDAMFAALSHQLFLPDDTIQASAAHGLNHLKDPRALPLLAHRARTTSNINLQEYLTAASGFNLM